MAEGTSDSRGPVLATIATSADGWFKAVSPQFLALLGQPVEALAAVNAVDLVHPMQASLVRKALATADSVVEQAITTQLFLANDIWSPVVVVIEQTVNERTTWRLHSVAGTPVLRPTKEQVVELPIAASAVSPVHVSHDSEPPDVSVAPPGSPSSGLDTGAPEPDALAPGAPQAGARHVVSDVFTSAPTTASAAPSLGGTSAAATVERVPHEDSGAHMAYVAMMPPDSVPEHRDAVRRSAGDDTTPMIEIDVDGRTVFVRGTWHELSTEGASGADVFEELLRKSGRAETILAAIETVTATAEPIDVEISVPGVPPRWVRVMPIPSPHLAGVVHALIAVVAESERAGAAPVPVDAPSAAGSWSEVRSEVGSESLGDGGVSAATPAAPDVDGADRPADASFARSFDDQNHAAPAAHTVESLEADKPGVLARLIAMMRPHDDSLSSSSLRPAPHTPPAEVELMTSTGRSTQLVWGVAGFFTYLAMQGLYFGPAFDWPSPLQGLLDSQACMIQPLCDNNVLPFNHLGVASLILAIAAFAVLFGQVGPRRLITERSSTSQPLAPTSWKFDLSGPGLFVWLGVIALLIVTAQTLLGHSASTIAWVAATLFGVLAAWRADRAAATPLGSTLAALAVALACLLIPLGIGTVWLGAHRFVGVLLLLTGLLLFAFSLRLIRRSHSSFDQLDYTAMVGLATLTAALGLLRHRTWRYAFIGDEWSFFEGALDDRRGNDVLATFDIGGPNDYFTGLTFELQSSVMQVAGDNVWGWRLSALLPMVLSVAAMYAFTKWLAGRTAALVAAIALGAGHMLLSFSMIGYNNSQSLVAVSASFAALAWAHQRPSALRFFLLGSAVGSTFLVYAMARLALLPLGLLFLMLFRQDMASFARRLAWSALGGLAMAAPALFSWRNWEALLKATPVQAEDSVLEAGGVGRQVVENTFAGWLSFIGSTRDSHFIVGPHLDVISAVLLIVGLGYVIARSRTDAAMRWFLIGGVALWTAINAIQQYAVISNTRSFMTPLVYCVFVGIGASALLPMIVARIPTDIPKRTLGFVGVLLLGLALVGVNQRHIGSHANQQQQLTEQALLVRQFEDTAGPDGDGMPIYVGWPEERNARLTMVLRAHDIAAERMVVVPVNGALNIAELCTRQDPAMVAMHQAHPQAITWADELAACWGTTPVTVTDPHGAPKLRRVTNIAGTAEFEASPDQRFSQQAGTSDYSLDNTIDIAIDGNGDAFALTRSDDGASIHQLATGRSFDLAQRQPIDFDITSDGLFVVAANGGDDRVVWYDGQGGVIRRYPGREEMPMIGGLAVDGDQLWISDTTRSRVLQVDADFKIVNVRSGQNLLGEPSAIAVGPDGGVWVFSARTGQIVLIDDQDQPRTTVDAQIFAPADVPRLSSTADGWLIRSVPERPVVELVDPDGKVIDARGGMNRPRAAAVRTGELVAADPRWNEVPVLGVDERWTPTPAGMISWGTRAVSADPEPLASPFVSDELVQPGPISTNLALTESVQVSESQTWQAIGAEILGEIHAVAVTDSGGFVADVNGRLIRLDAQGAAVGALSVSGGGTTFITDIATGQDEVLWVLDAGIGQLSRVGPDDSVTVLESDPGPLRNARGAGVGQDNTLFVASTASAQLVQIGADGQLVRAIPLSGRQPSDIAQAPDGTLWMIDAQELELVHLTEDGELLSELALTAFSSVESPHIAFDGDLLWVTEPEMSAVFAVDTSTGQPTGERIELARPDDARVNKPIGVAVSATGQLWLPDSIAGAIIVVDR